MLKAIKTVLNMRIGIKRVKKVNRKISANTQSDKNSFLKMVQDIRVSGKII